MYIDKALKREQRKKKVFYINMIFLGVFLPTIVYLSSIKSNFIFLYLAVLEVLIIIAIFIRINFYKLDFTCFNNKLKFKSGIISRRYMLICDKIAIVHTNGNSDDIEIILITTMRSKNKALKIINKDFMQRYPEAAHEYLKLKKIDLEKLYYFQIIKKGGFKKYILLDDIYKNCVKAVYTTSAIDNIKISRRQKEI